MSNEVARRKLARMNFWLAIVTVAVTLTYAGWTVYRASMNECPCDDGCTCWTPEDER